MAVDDAYTKILLHFWGSDGSQTITDESGKAWSAAGNAQIDTDVYKFAPSSLLLDGTGDYIYTSDNDDFNLGSGDWTIDWWVKKYANGVVYGQFSQGNAIRFYLNSVNRLYVNINSGAKTIYPATTLTDTASFHHIAVVRYGNVMTIYLDGTSLGTANMTGVTVDNSASDFVVGAYRTDENWHRGSMAEFRLSKGIARWTSNFTPPDSPYEPAGSPKVKTHRGINLLGRHGRRLVF